MPHRSDTSATRVTWMQHEWNTSDTSATRVRHKQHECKTSAARVLHKRHECNTSAKRTTRGWHKWTIFILITTWVKLYFHTLVFTIWQVNDYEERNNLILTTTFGNTSFPCQNVFKNCTTKTKLFNGKSHVRKLYTRL